MDRMDGAGIALPMNWNQLAVLGPGLLGGSIGLATRERGLARRVAVWARREEAAVRAGGVIRSDVATTRLAEALDGSDLVVVCTPVETIAPLLESAAPHLGSGAVVTDVGSVKGCIVPQAEEALRASGARFIGSHPMAGSERSGLDAARADLFAGAACLLTPTDASDADALDAVRAFWEALGCRLLTLSPAEHDRIVARISHLPHFAAAAMVGLAAASHPDATACVGNGFRDTTRVASASPELWTQIAAGNREALIEALDDLAVELSRVRDWVAGSEWNRLEDFLGMARKTRDNIRNPATH